MDLHADTIRDMVTTGHATTAHIAKHFEVTPRVAETFMRENDITFPRPSDIQYKHISKLFSAARPMEADWEALLWDDEQRTIMNGINVLTTDGKINANDILTYYQGELICAFSGERTTAVTAFDNNGSNFLVSNLVPVTEEIAEERKLGTLLPVMVVCKDYEFEGSETAPIKIGVNIHGRVDPLYHAVFNELHMDALFEQWVQPYFDNFTACQLLPEGMSPSPEMVTLWLWRHLSTVALVKGLARLDVTLHGVTASLSKDMYLQMVVSLMQRAAQSRAVASGPSGIITPGDPRFNAGVT